MILYDGRSPITWHGGKTTTAEDLASDPVRCALLTEPCVLIDNGVGVVYSWRRLEDMKKTYGIIEDDPEEALSLIRQERKKPKPTTQSNHSDNTETQEAIAELGILVDENAITLEDVLNAIAELGAIVAADE